MKETNDFLSQNSMNAFLVGLAGLPKDELKKAKLLFIRNAIIEYNNQKKQLKNFLYIPVLGWLYLLLNIPFISTEFENQKNKILNEIDIWKEDLVGETFVLDNKEIKI